MLSAVTALMGFATLLAALLTIEIAALVMGVIGCVTGTLALLKVVGAVKQINTVTVEQTATVNGLVTRVETLLNDE